MNSLVRRTAVVLSLIAAFALIWYTARVFLLAFGGILGATVLNAATRILADKTKMRRKRAFLAVLIGVLFLIALAIYLIAPRVAVQVSQLAHVLPEAIGNLRNWLSQYQWGRAVLQHAPAAIDFGSLIGNVGMAVKDIVYGGVELLVIAVVAAYVAADPTLYRGGLLALFPDSRREYAARVLNEVGYTLQWWLLGQLVPMAVLGVATTIGLYFLGVPLVFSLGLFTGLMVFIPYIGAFIAFVATVVITLSDDPAKVPWVAALFLGIHIAEGYLLTPMVQKRAVYLPPALTILMQVLMGILLGFYGIALATPLTAAILVLIKILYLDETPEHHHP